MKLSVIIPAYNEGKLIGSMLDSLKKQTIRDFELIVVDDCSNDDTAEIARRYAKVIKTKKNSGPAVARNIGIKEVSGEVIAFSDGDCIADKNWVENIKKAFKNKDISVIAGKTKVLRSNIIGDSISSLGFPGGGNLGFEKMWKVNKNGYTDHITSCNMAMRRNVFDKVGLFDEDFPIPGGEDAEFSFRLKSKGIKVKYCPNIVIFHSSMTSIISFIKWHIKRGEGNYYFKRKVGKVSNFVKLRLWSSKNIIKSFIFDKKIFFIIPLLFLSFIFQQVGYMKVLFKEIREKSI